jgi:hypothetical protein
MKYIVEAEEILEEYVNAYSQVDLEKVARKLESIAKDTAKETYYHMAKAYYDKENLEIFRAYLKKRFSVEVE